MKQDNTYYMESLTASLIITLAFTNVFENFTENARFKIDELRKKIVDKFQGRTDIETALQAASRGSKEDLDTVVAYLQVLMHEDPAFALELRVLAIEIKAGQIQDSGTITYVMKMVNKDGATGFQTLVTGGIANVGTHYHFPAEPFTPIKHIPYGGAKHFVGRSNELIEIHEKLCSSSKVAISAVAGMGGVGKTELAVKYARLHENDYPGGICWFSVRESNVAAEILTFAKNYLQLEVPQKDSQGQPLTLRQQVDWCWSKWRPPEGLVLVVLDDVTSVDNIADYLPNNTRFRVLITTRLRKIDINIEEIFLDVLSPDEALQLLKNIIGESRINQELETSQELCKWLGYLPLGIELVGRNITKKTPSFTLARMLAQLKEQRLQEEAINPKSKTLSTAQRGVLAAFELSWLEIDSKTQQVAALLSLFASEIFAWEWVESTIKNLSWNTNDAEIAVDELYGRHLVQCLKEEDKYYYKIHPLIREFLKDKLSAYNEIKLFKQAFTSTFIEVAQSIPHSPTLELINSVKNAIAHLAEIVQNLTDSVSDNDLSWAFHGLATFYSGQGLYTIAETWLLQRLSTVKFRLGDNHPDYATSLNNLASLYSEQGKYDKSELLYQRALELIKDILGNKHRDYAMILNNLANLYLKQGRYDKAEPLHQQALELTKYILGGNHPDYVMSLNNLANLYSEQGRYDKAEHLHQQSLELRKHILGDNHPDYVMSLNNLAYLYTCQGKYTQAEPLYQQALELSRHILGENHPHYAAILNHLVNLYWFQGQYDKAKSLCQEALELRKRILGENHPDYSTSFTNLANLHYLQGNYEKAEQMYGQVLELRKNILGENHPDYALSLNNLANLYSKQGKYDKAEPLYQQALMLAKDILKDNHPNYAMSLNNLAYLYFEQGKYDKAEPLYQQALEVAKNILGNNHPNYATILNHLANLYFKQAKYDKAELLYQRALELRKNILGENHPDYAMSLNNLANLYSEQGKYDEADSMYQQALELTKRILGENHPDYAMSLNNLGNIYSKQGKYDQAEKMYKKVLNIRKCILGENHPDYAMSLNNLAYLYISQHKYNKSELMLQEALKIAELNLGVNHPNTIIYRKNLKTLQNNFWHKVKKLFS